MGYDIDAAEDWLDSWTASVSAQAERAARLSRNVAALTGSARNADGSIRVTVGSGGQIETLELSDVVHRWPGARLAEQILVVMRQAQKDLAAKVAGEVEATVGSDSETGRAVIDSFETRFGRQDDQTGGADRGRLR